MTKRANIYYFTVGQGEPLVVLHGGPGLDHTYLAPYLEPLSKSHHLIYYDQRASGESGGTPSVEEISLPRFLSDLEALQRGLDLGPVHLLGHSWGALLALHYALIRPEQVRSLTLLHPWPKTREGLDHTLKRAYLRHSRTEQEVLSRAATSPKVLQGDPTAVNSYLNQWLAGSFKKSESLLTTPFSFKEQTAKNSLLIANLMLNHLGRYDLSEALIRVTAPTLLVGGAEDIVPLEELKALHNCLKEAKLVLLGNSSHFGFMEEPQACLEAIQTFLWRVNNHRASEITENL